MKKIQFLHLSTLILLTFSTTLFADLTDAVPVFKSGNWKIFRSTDSMTDNVDCTGVYQNNYGIQLTKDSVYVSVKGGIEGITLRFSEKPARSMREPSRIEKKLDAIIISDSDFTELLDSERLRVQTLTMVRGIISEDIDLKGIKPALENILASCPAKNIEEKPISTTISPTRSEPICNSELKSKMKANGVKEKQIQAICKN